MKISFSLPREGTLPQGVVTESSGTMVIVNWLTAWFLLK